MLKMKVTPLVIIYAFCAAPLTSEPDPTVSKNKSLIQTQETRWNMKDDSSRIFRASASPVRPLRSLLSVYEKRVILADVNRVDVENISFEFPKESFPKRGVLLVRIINLQEPVDYLFTGIALHEQHQNEKILLESKDMFRVTFFTEKGVRLEPKKPIRIKSKSGDTFALYHYTITGVWIKNQDNENISSSGWWSFSRPVDQKVCVKGKILNYQNDMMLTAYGESYAGLSYPKINREGGFKVQVVRNSKINLVVFRSGAGKYLLGSLAFDTASKNESEDGCINAGEILPFSVHPETFENKKLFMELLQRK